MLTGVTIPQPGIYRSCMAKVSEVVFAVFLRFVAGSSKFYLFHLNTNTWEELDDIDHGVEYPTCAVFDWEGRNGTDDRVLVYCKPNRKCHFFSITVGINREGVCCH